MKILLTVVVCCVMVVIVTARPGGHGRTRHEDRRNRCRYDRTVEWDRTACDVEGADLDVAMATKTYPLLSGTEECKATKTKVVKCSETDKRMARKERIDERKQFRKNGCKYDFWTAEWDSTACEEDGADLSKVKGTVTMTLITQKGELECPTVKVKSVSCNRFEKWSNWKKQLVELKKKIKETKQERIAAAKRQEKQSSS